MVDYDIAERQALRFWCLEQVVDNDEYRNSSVGDQIFQASKLYDYVVTGPVVFEVAETLPGGLKMGSGEMRLPGGDDE